MEWKQDAMGFPQIFGNDLLVNVKVKRGIGVCEMLGNDGVTAFHVFHARTKLTIGYLLAHPVAAYSIIDRIVAMQNWSKWRTADHVLDSTREAMDLFRSNHLFLREFPEEFTGMRAERAPSDGEPVSGSAASAG